MNLLEASFIIKRIAPYDRNFGKRKVLRCTVGADSRVCSVLP